ncbi:unnamed protein product [Phytomonas sp. Hart1]|nr:unnamed protein product [Phytomonas sp. Hart1]|eukprot:CCW70684.1 unnamed protein product [Phytomonas sp. isolate Hart1]
MPHRPLIGNWFEEDAYERDRTQLIQSRYGGLIDARSEVARIAAKITHHNTPTEIASIASDGYLRFFRPMMLQNACTLGYLSVDLEDRVQTTTGWRINCSTAAVDGANRRSVFMLLPSPAPLVGSYPVPLGEEDIVHYGQPFYITTIKSLCEEPLSLVSEFSLNRSYSKASGKHQEVYFSPDGGSAACMWYVVHKDPDCVEDMRDHPVRAQDAIMIQHNMTNAPLASTESVFYNDFGTQNEVCAGRFLRYASKRRAGPIENENCWIFIHHGQGAPEGVNSTTTVESTIDPNAETNFSSNAGNITANTTVDTSNVNNSRFHTRGERSVRWEDEKR